MLHAKNNAPAVFFTLLVAPPDNASAADDLFPAASETQNRQFATVFVSANLGTQLRLTESSHGVMRFYGVIENEAF
jgi:hypothetical protein